MKKIVIALAGLGVLLGAVSANAGPEEDRLKLVSYFKNKYPDVKTEDYVYGALAFDPDAMSQYKSIMEFPPYSGELDKGEKLWKTPLKSGKTYADCLPNGGKEIAGNYPMFDEAKGKVVTLEDVINACRVANVVDFFLQLRISTRIDSRNRSAFLIQPIHFRVVFQIEHQ